MDDEAVILQAIEALLKEGLDRRMIEKALVEYAPLDLDLFADCFVKALASVRRSSRLQGRSMAA
ncbi:hypothetical protein ABRA89_06820 [Fulvimarina sp. MAC8]